MLEASKAPQYFENFYNVKFAFYVDSKSNDKFFVNDLKNFDTLRNHFRFFLVIIK